MAKIKHPLIIKDGYRNGGIMPGNCFYIYSGEKMICTVYSIKDAELIKNAVNEYLKLQKREPEFGESTGGSEINLG